MRFGTVIVPLAALSLAAIPLASCGARAGSGQVVAASPTAAQLAITDVATFDEPWAARFAPGTGVLYVTERGGTMKFVDTASGRLGTVTGLPRVDYQGQGGLGDVAFLPSEASATLDRRTIYLTWAEAGPGNTRGAALGRGTLICEQADLCRIEGLKVIWRQQPKVTGSGHYSHRIAFSPDGRYLFLSSGERQKGAPAQDLSVNLGKILRLLPDGSPAPGNPFADSGGVASQIWSYGHRNVLGLQFDSAGRLWGLEHGPAGGDELNLIEPGRNYGWPLVSDGDDYSGAPIPRHATRPDLAAPAVSWNPVIAPGDFIFCSGKLFPQWKGQAIATGLKTEALVRIAIDGTKARELGRIAMVRRIREIREGPDGALWILEDGSGGRLRKLTPKP